MMDGWQRWGRATSWRRRIIDRRVATRLRRIVCVIFIFCWHSHLTFDGFLSLWHLGWLMKLIGLKIVVGCRRPNAAIGCLYYWRSGSTRWSWRCEVCRWWNVSGIVTMDRSRLYVIVAEWIFSLRWWSEIFLRIAESWIFAVQESICLLLHRYCIVVVGILTWSPQVSSWSAQVAQVFLVTSQ